MAASWPGVSLRDHSAALLGPNGVVVIMEVSHELDYSIADCIHAFSFNATFLCSVFFQPKSSSMHAFKWTVQRDFRPPCFSSFKPAWATVQWVKIFSILVKISLSYSNFSVKMDSPGIIPCRVKKKFYPRTCLQKCKMWPFISLIWIHIYFCDTVPLKARANILRIGC